ncbi:hypothetical protein RND81_03G170600 [Saponaria officinalis]|uniref:Major facilitator superfamily (MFS) profile domain-containing protein n=1 Tax=Saponaria officinalis TaxID=3572 RepID=A0AAW1MA12_SAPOF
MHEELATAANSVNIWVGVSLVMPIFGGFLGDAYVGRFFMTLFSAILYILALLLLIMTQYIPSLKPCNNTTSMSCLNVNKTHKVVFFTAAYLVSIATGGVKPCLEAFGADQFDDNHSKERKQKMSYFNWWNVFLNAGGILGVTVIVYLQDNVGWGAAFILTTTVMGLAVVTFFFSRSFYRYRTAQGSPLTPLLMVLVAALAKRHLSCPSDSSLLYEVPVSESRQGQVLSHTNRLRFLDKAAILEENNIRPAGKKNKPRRLTTVTQVEELKLIINLIPIWLASLIFGIGSSQSQTFFIKQASSTNRRVSNHFDIPAASLGTLTSIISFITAPIYDKVLVPYLRRKTGNERGITILNRIAIGMVLFIMSMMVAALVESKRLIALGNGDKLRVFWLAPQVLIIGLGDTFSLIGLQELFYDQVPDSMRSLGVAFCLSVIGVGGFLSSLLIAIVNSVTGINSGMKWIGKDVNHSRLDRYYWFLTLIFVLNLGVFIVLIKHYSYKRVEPIVGDCESRKSDKVVELANV